MIRSLGLPYSRMEAEGIMLPVVEAALEYRSPVHYDEEMAIRVSVFEVPQVRLVTWYEVMTDREEEPHAIGRVTLAFSDMETRRPCRAPEDFLTRRSEERRVGKERRWQWLRWQYTQEGKNNSTGH